MSDDSTKQDLREALFPAVSDALQIISGAIAEGRFISSEYNWPSLSWYRSNGMPALSKQANGPPDYTSAFSGPLGANPPTPDPSDSLPSFDRLQELLFGSDFLRDRLIGQERPKPDAKFDYGTFTARFLPKQLAARYVSVYGSAGLDQSRLEAVYSPLEAAIFQERLSFDLWIPILFLNFTFSDLRIGESAKVIRIPDEYHLARALVRDYGTGGHEQVMACATHVLILEGWSIANRPHSALSQTFSSQGAYPKEDIERFFGALRTVTGVDTGYCQLLVVPSNWALDWRAFLPPLKGTSLRAYPGFFEAFHWNMPELPKLSVDQVSSCGLVFKKFQEAEENSMAIAVRRLNRCYCRDDEEDILIDATIALEALLSDDEPQEMTHKLALRVAAVSQLVPGQTKSAQEVFSDIKSVYRHRSKVVHGRAPKDKDRVVGSDPQQHVATSQVAREHLRSVLRVLTENTEFRSGTKVDQLLMSRVTAMHLGQPSA